jgi:metal-responsive CopG/Arc/MetJ family transcriptional regulator
MAVHKLAISVPKDVIAEVDRAAKRLGVTRSRFISDVLRKVARARTDAEITRRLDAVFGDPEVAAEQRRTNREFIGARGSDEKW